MLVRAPAVALSRLHEQVVKAAVSAAALATVLAAEWSSEVERESRAVSC